MNHKKNKRKSNGLQIAIIALALILVAVLCILGILLSKQSRNSDTPLPPQTEGVETTEPTEILEPTEPEPTEPEPTEEPTEESATEPVVEATTPPAKAEAAELVDFSDGQIVTPYVTLNYPEMFADHLLVAKMSEEPYTLAFYAIMEQKDELRLFDIALGQGTEGNMGTVKTAQGEIPMDFTMYTLSFDGLWTDSEITTAYAMQDAANDLIAALTIEETPEQESAPVVVDPPETGVVVNYLEITAPTVTLYYPARWSSTVSIEEVEDTENGIYKVNFFSRIEGRENQLMFSVYLGGDEGEQLGAVMGSDGVPLPVYLMMYEPDLEGWSEEDAQLVYSMQEAVNQLIEMLDLLA